MITLGPDEFVQVEERKHWFILFAELLGYIILYVLPFGIYYVLSYYLLPTAGSHIDISLSPALATFLTASWSLIIWMRLISVWTDYYLDIWIVTSKRILDLEQKGLFHRKSSVFRIERIQDVTVETKGAIATLLNFGDIHVQTAGEAHEFVMRGITNPKRVRKIILQQLDLVAESTSGRTSNSSAN